MAVVSAEEFSRYLKMVLFIIAVVFAEECPRYLKILGIDWIRDYTHLDE